MEMINKYIFIGSGLQKLLELGEEDDVEEYLTKYGMSDSSLDETMDLITEELIRAQHERDED